MKLIGATKIVPERTNEAIGIRIRGTRVEQVKDEHCGIGTEFRAHRVELVNSFLFFLSVHEKSGRVTFEILHIPRTEKVGSCD